MKVFVGLDWAEDHHDLLLINEAGRRLAGGRVPEGTAGVARVHGWLAEFIDEPGEVLIATETDRGLFINALVAAGYGVIAVNPKSVARYRERFSSSGAKSDPGDARVLADLARTNGHLHRPLAGDSDLVESVKLLARAHQSMIWSRQRQANQLRSILREFYPAALSAFGNLTDRDAMAVLAIAPTPTAGRQLSRAKIASALKRGGRQRRIESRSIEIQTALQSEQLTAPNLMVDAMGAIVSSSVAVLSELTRQIAALEQQLADRFSDHPDTKIILSLPGLGMTLGARVLGEFGDDPNRYADAKSRKNYAGTAPITRTSGKQRAVLARFVRNRRLADACQLWAQCSLRSSPGAKAFYQEHRDRGNGHNKALRALANRLVGILHGCLHHHAVYDEHTAWGHRQQQAA